MITLQDVSKYYGDFKVLSGCSATIAKGEVVVVCGPSGSGKSTLIKTINALEPIQEGSITVDGIKVNDRSTNLPRCGSLGRVMIPLLLLSDNDLVFTSPSYTVLVRSYGLQQEFITPHCPQQNGMVERVIRTLKEQCTHWRRLGTLQQASRIIGG